MSSAALASLADRSPVTFFPPSLRNAVRGVLLGCSAVMNDHMFADIGIPRDQIDVAARSPDVLGWHAW